MRYTWIIICLILGVLSVEAVHIQKENEPWFPIWGVYCGLGHSNHYGKEPIDMMDRYCQFHDICVTISDQGYHSCWCNEQLYYLVSNYKPENKNESDIKSSILYYIYIALTDCDDYWGFDTHIKISRVRPDVGERGFNYLTYYPQGYPESYEVRMNDTSQETYILELAPNEYSNFTVDVHVDPTNNINRWMSHSVHTLDENPFVFDVTDKMVVLYNPSSTHEVTFQVRNVTTCTTVSHTYYEKVVNHIAEIGVAVCLAVIVLLTLLSCTICCCCLWFRRKYRREKNREVVSPSVWDY